MIEAANDNSETALAEFLNNFITVRDVVVITHVVLLLVSIEAVIRALIDSAPFNATRLLRILAPILVPFIRVKVVNCRVIVNFTLFILI